MSSAIVNQNQNLLGEVIDLATEIALVSPTDTPLYTILASRGLIVPAKDISVTWREKTLDQSIGTILEGAEAGASIKSTRGLISNLCQIMEKVTSVSGTERSLAILGIGDEFNAEVQDRLIETKRDCEWYFLQGTKTAESGATPRQMNGLLNMVNATNVIDLSNGSRTGFVGKLQENDFLDSLQSIWNSGSQGEYFTFVNAHAKRAINDLLKTSTSTRYMATSGENTMGIIVNKIETDFGVINLVLDRYMPTTSVLTVDMDMVQIAELRSAFYEDLAKTGDYSKGHVVVENSIKLLNSYSGAKLINLV
jgi:hypothetical protein